MALYYSSCTVSNNISIELSAIFGGIFILKNKVLKKTAFNNIIVNEKFVSMQPSKDAIIIMNHPLHNTVATLLSIDVLFWQFKGKNYNNIYKHVMIIIGPGVHFYRLIITVVLKSPFCINE